MIGLWYIIVLAVIFALLAVSICWRQHVLTKREHARWEMEYYIRGPWDDE